MYIPDSLRYYCSGNDDCPPPSPGPQFDTEGHQDSRLGSEGSALTDNGRSMPSSARESSRELPRQCNECVEPPPPPPRGRVGGTPPGADGFEGGCGGGVNTAGDGGVGPAEYVPRCSRCLEGAEMQGREQGQWLVQGQQGQGRGRAANLLCQAVVVHHPITANACPAPVGRFDCSRPAASAN